MREGRSTKPGKIEAALVRGAMALLLLLAGSASLAEDGRVTLEPQSMADAMLRRPWLRQLPLAWPTPEPAERPRNASAPRERGWQLSLEVQEPVRQAQFDPAAAYRLPVLGADVPKGTAFSGGLRKAFGDWTVRIGLKQQDSVAYGSFRKPALSATWQPEGGPMLAGIALSRSSRTAGFWSAGNPFAGNAQATAEKGQQAEIYFANAGNSPWRTRLSLFQAYYRDMMDFDGGPPPSLVNRARVYVRGAEASVSRRWDSGAQAYLHLATLASYDPDSGIDLHYRPHQQATSGFSLPLYGPLHLHASLTWYGRRVDATGSTEATGSYAETGTMLSWKTRTSQAFLAVDNLTDRRANDLMPGWANGRRIRLGWQGHF